MATALKIVAIIGVGRGGLAVAVAIGIKRFDYNLTLVEQSSRFYRVHLMWHQTTGFP